MYQFKRSTEVYVIPTLPSYGGMGIGHRLTSVSDFNYNQTMSATTIDRKNMFKLVAPKSVVNRRANVGSGSIAAYLAPECVALRDLLYNLDFNFDGGSKFIFSNEFTARPTPITLLFKDAVSGEAVTLRNVIITNLDVGCSPGSMNLLSFGFEFSELITHDASNTFLNQGIDPIYRSPGYIDFKLGADNINSVKSAAFTITRSIDWLSDGADQFNVGKVAYPRNPVVSGLDISATAECNDIMYSNGQASRGAIVTYSPSSLLSKTIRGLTVDTIIGNKAFGLHLPKARVTARKQVGEVFSIAFDIKHQSMRPAEIVINRF